MSRADEIFAQNMQEILQKGFWDTELSVRPHRKIIRYRQPLQLAGGVSHSHHAPYGVPLLRGRIALDLAEKEQQHSRLKFPYLGQLGGRNGFDRQSVRLSVGGQAPL